MARQRKIKSETANDVMDLADSDGNDNDDDNNNKEQPIVVDPVTSSNVVLTGALYGSDDSNNNDDIDDDDEIVREIPVFLSPELGQQIQLIQYPLQQRANYSPAAPEAVRVKPRHCMVEMDLPTPSNIQFNGMYHMPSRTFSSQTVPVSTHMALGKMMMGAGANDNDPKQLGLHLVPLSRMTQMRPSFSHVDEAAASATATTEEELKRQQQSSAGGVDPVTGRKSISFQKKESERQELARKSSYSYKKACEDAEGWHSLEVYDEASLQAQLVMSKVACPVEHQSRNLLDAGTLEKESNAASSTGSRSNIPGNTLNATYLNTLNYLPPREDFGGEPAIKPYVSPTGGDDGDDDDEQGKLTWIVTKLVQLMRQGRPIPFSLLRAEFTSTQVSDSTLFVALGSCAVIVRGNWCLNSKLLSYSPAMTQARTFLLCLFQSMRVVHRERLMRVFDAGNTGDNKKKHPDQEIIIADDDKVTAEVIEFLLEQVGEKRKEGWVLKVDDDVKFSETNPQTAVVHLQYWANQIELFRPMLQRYRAYYNTNDDEIMGESY